MGTRSVEMRAAVRAIFIVAGAVLVVGATAPQRASYFLYLAGLVAMYLGNRRSPFRLPTPRALFAGLESPVGEGPQEPHAYDRLSIHLNTDWVMPRVWAVVLIVTVGPVMIRTTYLITRRMMMESTLVGSAVVIGATAVVALASALLAPPLEEQVRTEPGC